jgi:hypothetical protein
VYYADVFEANKNKFLNIWQRDGTRGHPNFVSPLPKYALKEILQPNTILCLTLDKVLAHKWVTEKRDHYTSFVRQLVCSVSGTVPATKSEQPTTG